MAPAMLRFRGLGTTRSFVTLARRQYRVLFFGSNDISLETLKLLHDRKGDLISHLEVVCSPERPHGRGLRAETGPVKRFALDHQLTVHQPPPELKSLKNWELPANSAVETFDFGVAVSFGYLIPARFVSSFNMGAINMHPSLLPKYRGAAPINHALINNDQETGVSIIELHPNRFDEGRLLKQTRIPLPPSVTFNDIYMDLAKKGAQDVIDVLTHYDRYNESAQPQSQHGVTRAPKFTKEDGILDWHTMTATEVFCRWRGLFDMVPVTTSFLGHNVHIRKMRNPDELQPESNLTPVTCEPGTLFYDKLMKTLFVRCSDRWIACDQLKMENKAVVSAEAFANGYQLKRQQLSFGEKRTA